jgi:hypothetical protein
VTPSFSPDVEEVEFVSKYVTAYRVFAPATDGVILLAGSPGNASTIVDGEPVVPSAEIRRPLRNQLPPMA